YRAISNNLLALNLRDLMDAARVHGASTWQAAFWVVLPNLRKGVGVALFLSFSFLLGEFVFANLLVGTRYETLQVYLNNMRNSSGHFNSALVISSFFFVLACNCIANRLNRVLPCAFWSSRDCTSAAGRPACSATSAATSSAASS